VSGGRGERMRAGGPLDCIVRRRQDRALHQRRPRRGLASLTHRRGAGSTSRRWCSARTSRWHGRWPWSWRSTSWVRGVVASRWAW